MNTPGELIDANGTASIAVSGVPSPVLTGQCSAIGFGCESDATLAYFFDVVPLDGDTNQTAIDLGINAAGSISVDTSGNSQSTNSNIELIVGTGPGGSFFDDLAQVDYNAGCDSGVTPPCSAVDDSSSNDNGFVSTPGVDGSTPGAPGQS